MPCGPHWTPTPLSFIFPDNHLSQHFTDLDSLVCQTSLSQKHPREFHTPCFAPCDPVPQPHTYFSSHKFPNLHLSQKKIHLTENRNVKIIIFNLAMLEPALGSICCTSDPKYRDLVWKLPPKKRFACRRWVPRGWGPSHLYCPNSWHIDIS